MIHALLVEDDRLVREMIAERLRLEGLEVSLAENGRRGLALACQLQPAVILMDMGMPGMDGWQATRLLKEDARTRHIPIIALTAYTAFRDMKRSYQAGCDEFVSKPINFGDLLAKIQRLASEAGSEGPAGQDGNNGDSAGGGD